MNEEQLFLLLQNQVYGIDYVFGQPIIYLPMPSQQEQVKQEQEQPNKNDETKETQQNKLIPFILHKVNPNRDTLMGLSIQYNVSAYKIKRFNEMDNDEIYYMSTIKIPYKTEEDVKNMEEITPKTKEYEENLVKIQRAIQLSYFQDHVVQQDDRCEQVAKFYLEEAGWDEQKATKLYQDDLNWEKQNEGQIRHTHWVRI